MTADDPPDTRFRKGVSGNPKGRPKKVRPEAEKSAFEFLTSQTVKITQGGQERSVGLSEALQHKLYQEALAGKRSSQKEILRMIMAREKAIADQNPIDWNMGPISFTGDPENAEAALLALGIVAHDRRWAELHENDPYTRLLLEPWAVQAALSRPGGRQFDEEDVSRIELYTRDHETVRWPRDRKS